RTTIVSGTQLPFDTYDIGEADIAVDPMGNLHLTWSAAEKREGGSRRFCYQHSYDRGKTWSHPLRLEVDYFARVFPSRRDIHLVGFLTHLLSQDGGRSWRKVEPVIPLLSGGDTNFDAICLGETLFVAYLEADAERSQVYLKVTRWLGSREIDRRVLGKVP